jgi:hypothetical protein
MEAKTQKMRRPALHARMVDRQITFVHRASTKQARPVPAVILPTHKPAVSAPMVDRQITFVHRVSTKQVRLAPAVILPTNKPAISATVVRRIIVWRVQKERVRPAPAVVLLIHNPVLGAPVDTTNRLTPSWVLLVHLTPYLFVRMHRARMHQRHPPPKPTVSAPSFQPVTKVSEKHKHPLL